MDIHLVPTPRLSDDIDEIPPIPKDAIRFRLILNEIKRGIMATLEEKGDGNQDATLLNQVVDRIQHLGNILRYLLNSEEQAQPWDLAEGESMDKSVETIENVLKAFQAEGVDFDSLEPSTREYCLNYVSLDIDMYPYDLNPNHINSVSAATGPK